MKLLTTQSAKTRKGEKRGYLTGILYLKPADSSGVINVCPYATEECKATCLNSAGRGQFRRTQRARLRKTLWLARDRESFLRQLRADIFALERKAKRESMTPCVRINGTSDLPAVAEKMVSEFPHIQFYDYTKVPMPWKRIRANYRLTFSYSGHNAEEARSALEHGINVAVVFAVKRGAPLPETWNNLPVIDGDESDLRFLDRSGVVVGLRAKGKAKKAAKNPFVILS